MSIIGYPPPSAVEVGGGEIPINTSHRCGVRVASIIDDPTIDDAIAVQAILMNYFPGLSPDEMASYGDGLFDAAMRFFFRGDYDPAHILAQASKKRPARKAKERIWDWEIDADILVADFQREYGIDITDPDTMLHWWRFKALFDCLGDTSMTMRIKSIRSQSLRDCKTPEERDLLREQKKAVALPPRTASEVELEI